MARWEDLSLGIARIRSLRLGTGLGVEVSPTASQMNLLVQGLAAGYKMARGSVVATASASVATGLATVVDFIHMVRGNTATLANGCAAVTGKNGAIAGTIQMWRWKHTGPSTATLVAATVAGTLNWIAVGT